MTLADGRVVLLTQVDIGAILNAGLSTLNLVGLTLTTPTFAGVITFSSTPVFPTLTAKSMTYVDASQILTSTAAPTNGQLLIGSTGAIPVLATLTAGSNISITNAAGAITIASAPRSYLAGYGLSTAGSSTTMTIGAGTATDSTNAQAVARSTSIAKTTGAWVVGTAQGGLDTGSIQASTTYHFYAILRTDTGVTDVTFSTNATTPTLPANYSYYRRIASWRTDGSSNWVAAFQDGDLFQLNTAVVDLTETSNPGTALRTLTSIPTGINVLARMRVALRSANSGATSIASVNVLDPALADEAPLSNNANNIYASLGGTLNASGATNHLTTEITCRTNTSAQCRFNVAFSDANSFLTVETIGWIDSRGRNA